MKTLNEAYSRTWRQGYNVFWKWQNKTKKMTNVHKKQTKNTYFFYHFWKGHSHACSYQMHGRPTTYPARKGISAKVSESYIFSTKNYFMAFLRIFWKFLTTSCSLLKYSSLIHELHYVVLVNLFQIIYVTFTNTLHFLCM